MKRSLWVVLVLLLCAGYALTKSNADSDAAAIKALEEKWATSANNNDAAGVAAILADSATITGSDGVMRNKAETMAAMKDRKYETAVGEDIKVAVYGDAAVATGVWRAKGTENGKPFAEVERFTDTYVRNGGQWKCVAEHASAMKSN
jgi:uncharacterized protein (TIGR02246 family)